MTDEQHFSIGEIAIWARPGSPTYGERVCVMGPLKQRGLWDRRTPGVRVEVDCYPIEWLDADHGVPEVGKHWLARPEHLRKLPPKQDWQRLCKLDELPREMTHA